LIEQAPNWFVTEMKAFDSALRVRWSQKMNMWQLERKIANSKPIDTTKRDGYDDDYIRAREGYILIALIPNDKFSRQIFETLRASDLWSQGGWESMARYIEDTEAAAEEKFWNDYSDELKAQTAEIYNFLKYREGSRIVNIGIPGA
jgi:hypothetical protein